MDKKEITVARTPRELVVDMIHGHDIVKGSTGRIMEFLKGTLQVATDGLRERGEDPEKNTYITAIRDAVGEIFLLNMASIILNIRLDLADKLHMMRKVANFSLASGMLSERGAEMVRETIKLFEAGMAAIQEEEQQNTPNHNGSQSVN